MPRSLPALVVRRLFTIAARSQYERVTPEVATLLESVGAVAPTVNQQGNLTCFGVLYAKNHRICSACRLRVACATKASNHGLDAVALSPKLFHARALVRTAEACDATTLGLPTTLQAPRPRPASEREDEIRAYLEQHFKRVECFEEEYYVHKVKRRDNKVKHIVWVGAKPNLTNPDVNPAFLVRFCTTADRPALQKQLIRVGPGYYAPESLPVAELIELIDAHADYLFKLKID